jgi:hypothetical protein
MHEQRARDSFLTRSPLKSKPSALPPDPAETTDQLYRFQGLPGTLLLHRSLDYFDAKEGLCRVTLKWVSFENNELRHLSPGIC